MLTGFGYQINFRANSDSIYPLFLSIQLHNNIISQLIHGGLSFSSSITLINSIILIFFHFSYLITNNIGPEILFPVLHCHSSLLSALSEFVLHVINENTDIKIYFILLCFWPILGTDTYFYR